MQRVILLSILSIFSIFSVFGKSYEEIKDTSNLQLKNPSLKERQTLKIRLDNGLEAYIISDKNADKSAAALGVKVGFWQDPIDYPGTAHFCEHMLFQGSAKYPEGKNYWSYLFDNGGGPNAYTAEDRTVYMFSVNTPAFEGALDRLSHFFKDPLFNPADIQRELYAIDQEHSKNIEHDGRRKWAVFQEIGNQNHPNAKFSTGNSETLKNMPFNELKSWYETHYSSNLMTLVVYSPLKMAELKKMVIEKFSGIKNLKKEPFEVKESLFSEDNAGKIVYIKPVSNIQILSLEWEFDNDAIRDETKTLELIAYTLKRGQKHSLFQDLKSQYLAEDLDIGVEKLGANKTLFLLEVELTNKGLQNISKVIKDCQSAINNLKISGIPKYLFDEMQKMSKLNYEYQSHMDAFTFVTMHTSNLLNEDLANYPRDRVLAKGYSPKSISDTLNELNFSNCQYYILAPLKNHKIKLDKKEKWTGAEYTVLDMKRSLKKELSKNPTNSNIRVPSPNTFIPNDLEIVEDSSEEILPVRIISNDFGVVYYKSDNTFNVPEVNWHFQIKAASLSNNAQSQVLKELYVKALNDKLTSTFFAARAAGLLPDIYSKTNSINIDISGYSEKATLLLEDILKTIKTLKVSREDFDIYYSSLKKSFQNQKKILPIFQAQNHFQSILISSSLTTDQQLNALNKITYLDFKNFKEKLFTKTYIEAMVTGNLRPKDAESLFLDIKDVLGKESFAPQDHYKKDVFALSNTGPFFIHKNIALLGNGVLLALDEGNFTFRKRSSQTILSQALKEAFFTSLRSKQKTAYMTYAVDLEVERRLYQIFLVQSNSHEPLDLIARFEIFLEEYLQDLTENITLERFENIRANLITVLKTPFKNLDEMSGSYNLLAFEYNADFAWRERRIKALEELSYEDFLSDSEKFLSKENRGRLAILYEGKIDKNFKYEEIEEVDFKKIGSYQNKKADVAF